MNALDVTLEKITSYFRIHGIYPTVEWLVRNMALKRKTITDRLKQLKQAGSITLGNKFEIIGVAYKKPWLCMPIVGVAA